MGEDDVAVAWYRHLGCLLRHSALHWTVPLLSHLFYRGLYRRLLHLDFDVCLVLDDSFYGLVQNWRTSMGQLQFLYDCPDLQAVVEVDDGFAGSQGWLCRQ